MIGEPVAARLTGTQRPLVEAILDAAAANVETIVYPFTAPVETFVGVRKRTLSGNEAGTGNSGQYDGN